MADHALRRQAETTTNKPTGEEKMNEENTKIDRATICHPSPSGKGSALRLELHPAHGSATGYIMIELARQKSVVSVQGEVTTFATFDWDNAIVAKLCVGDIAQMLMVFRGMQESIQDGKGIFHRTATANAIIKFSHQIEPRPGYCLEVSRKPFDGELSGAFIVFSPEEAYWLSLALEGAMPALVFGVQSVRA
jgi:hypothetical protein